MSDPDTHIPTLTVEPGRITELLKWIPKCLICYRMTAPLRQLTCGHPFCQPCMASFVSHQLLSLMCDLPVRCGCPIEEADVAWADPRNLESFRDLTVATQYNSFFCPNRQCMAPLPRYPQRYNWTHFLVRICKQCDLASCVECERPFHGSMSCKKALEVEKRKSSGDVLVFDQKARCAKCGRIAKP
ncbi:hypothetical protein GGR53DRAFT_464527 [Hypoxylon sp. FL1150]|nr:hypothetical protein GGR53DRAFT_464527 [Hypoxylon sp. FL1150]